MKALTFALLLEISVVSFGQRPDSYITIDTITVTHTIPGIDSLTSFIPQLKSEFNTTIINKINQDIRSYFMAYGIPSDSAEYVKQLFESNDVETLKEYEELKEGESAEEFFEVEYQGESFVNIGYQFQVLPYHGQYQFFFTSLIYDLRKGKKLKFADFFSINVNQLTALLESEGNFIYKDGEGSDIKEKINFGDNAVEEHIQSLLNDSTNSCTEFYFREIEKEMYLCFKFKCYGPQLIDCGIPLSTLKAYIVFPEFKNMFKLWGEGAQSLIGSNISGTGNTINFEKYTVALGGGYLIHDDQKKDSSIYGIMYAHSDSSSFYFFTKHTNNNEIIKVLDVLEIKKEDMTNKKWVESYCYTDAVDPELIALVKTNDKEQGYYYNIIKAWRANRQTEKFETVNRNKVKKCENESYGRE
ncbi:MAG: hypothetical protein ABI772_08025 [Bacteroidota bacterium]